MDGEEGDEGNKMQFQSQQQKLEGGRVPLIRWVILEQ
jgi:hypothetical protein